MRGGMLVGVGYSDEGNKGDKKIGTTVAAQSIKYTLKKTTLFFLLQESK